MSRFFEICTLIIGGVSLFAASFMGFALMSGTPAHEIALVGHWFPEPAFLASPGEVPPLAAEKSDVRIVEANLGVLGAFDLGSPYTRNELRQLTSDLEAKRQDYETRLAELEVREGEIASLEAALLERLGSLESMRKGLDVYARDLDLRQAEVTRDEVAVDDRVQAERQDLARLLTDLDPREAARRLAGFEPGNGAAILIHIEPDLASEILGEVSRTSWKALAEAYAQARAAQKTSG